MYVAVMGYGTVGSGVVEVMRKNHDSIVPKTTQKDLTVKRILDLRDFPGDPNEGMFTREFSDILSDDEIGIVVETMGGLHPAFEYVSACLRAGKSVVTSNKELVAAKGYELLHLADEQNVNFLFEASVGGGIPILRPITQCLAANDITEIAGILNGTTNFILTMMIERSMSFETALRLAQEKGYAEKDPAADVEGLDACRKVCILASLCFGRHVFPSGVHTEGIRTITSEDVEYARDYGGVIKLLGRARREKNGKISAMVSPCVIHNGSQLATVADVFNAILVRGDVIGDVVFYGRGAGKLPTASAVVADVIDCAKHIARKKLFGWGPPEENYIVNHKTLETALYVRAEAKDRTAALTEARQAFDGFRELSRENAPKNEFAFVTGRERESALDEKLSRLKGVRLLSSIRLADY